MSMLKTKQPTYNDGRTKQSFKDETDINKILQRAQKTGTISHMNQFSGQYGDFSDFDFFENTIMLTRGREIFDALPSEIRNEFSQSPAAFFKYVNDPANKEDLLKKLPGLAAPGRQNIDVSGKAAGAAASEPEASEKPKATSDVAASTTMPPAASEAAKSLPADSAAESSAPT